MCTSAFATTISNIIKVNESHLDQFQYYMYEFHEHIKIYYTYYNAMSGVMYESCFGIIVFETHDA